MRISDWSSDVCSSDLEPRFRILDRVDHERPLLADERQARGTGPFGRAIDEMLGQLDILHQLHMRIEVEGRREHAIKIAGARERSEEHTSELQSLMSI